MPTGSMTQPAWLAFAWTELGQREVPGPASNSRIAAMIRRVGHAEAADDATAWCAAFVGASLEQAGLRSTGSLLARSYLAWGEPADPPDAGSITVLSRGSDPDAGHVAFLVGMTDDSVVLLGGNQSDAVSVEAFPRSRVVAFRRPASASPAATDASAPPASDDTAGFERALSSVLASEGGYTDDPFDPGGPTNKGITLAEYADVEGTELTAETVDRLKSELRSLPDALAARIYRERYWQPAVCASLPPALAHFHFDAAVNQGVAGSARMLQEALGVAIDGEIGPDTLAAASRNPLPAALRAYAAIRRRRYRALSQFWRFGRGWLARVDRVLAEAEAIAGGASAAIPASQPKEKPAMPDTTATSTTTSSVPADTKWWGNSLTIWGALLTGATTVAPAVFAAFGLNVSTELVQQLGSNVVTLVQAVAGLAGTVMTIAGRVRATQSIERRNVSLKL